MASKTPGLDKLEAVIRALGGNPSVSFQMREAGDTGFFTITYSTTGERCAIGQGDTLADALEAARRNAVALAAKVSVRDLETVAA